MLTKHVVLNIIRFKYPDADIVTADIARNLLTARCSQDESKTKHDTLGQSEYIPVLESEYGIKDLALIEIDMRAKKIKFIGSNTEKIV